MCYSFEKYIVKCPNQEIKKVNMETRSKLSLLAHDDTALRQTESFTTARYRNFTTAWTFYSQRVSDWPA